MNKLRHFSAGVLVATAVLMTGPATATVITAIEYYDPILDHYFVTASSDEIAKLDAGVFSGWQRTGQSFDVFDPATVVTGVTPVCRFYGSPAAGLDSHFYSASPAECAAVRERFPGIWIPESDNVFGVFLPNLQTGQCPPTTTPVYRAWNNRIDSNHRYTTDFATLQAMVAKGYIAEGYGSPVPVAMCAPDSGSTTGGTVPSCTVVASNTAPYVGSSVVLTASCNNAPTAFSWTGCSGTGTTCSATSQALGQAIYTVVASNAAGSGAPASATVYWQALPPPPVCSMSRTMQTDPPVVNGLVVLRATCNSTVGSYSWSGCSSTTNLCLARESTTGARTYSLIARNAGGSSAPVAMTVSWVASPPPPPGLCSQFPSDLLSYVGSNSVRVETASFSQTPAFAWNGAWAVRFTVPSTADPAKLGRLSAGEYVGQPTTREATISRQACDFRATDPTGANGPYARVSGVTTTNWYTVDPAQTAYPLLQPGGTYYYNLRNWQPQDSTISCPSSPGRCDAFVDTFLP